MQSPLASRSSPRGCRPIRSSASSRHTLSSLACAALACGGLVACSSDNSSTGSSGSSQDELASILKDGDLTLLSRQALTLTAPRPSSGGVVPPGMVVPGAGGSAVSGSAGSTGSTDGGVGGAVGDGGGEDASSGTGGTIGFDGGGMGGFGGQFPEGAQGLWMFEDCNPDRTDLNDSGFNFHTAFRSVSAACTEGIQGQAIGIAAATDYVYVPDQPNFVFTDGVTAAAWVKPSKLGDVRTIFRKREGSSSTFVLLSNGRDYQFVVHLSNGRAVAVSARAKLNVWTHVAGTYDGVELRLYLDGKLAAHARAKGSLSSGAGPLLMGNDAFGRRIEGSLDNVFFDIVAATPEQIARLTCIPRPGTLVAVPGAGPEVPAGTAVSYDVRLTNNDSPSCDPRAFQLQAFGQSSFINVTPNFVSLEGIAPGTTAHQALSVSSTADAEVDDFVVDISAFQNNPPFDSLSTSVTYSVKGGPCSIRSRRELSIRDVSVVDDPVRTAAGGAWTFGRLMENMAPTPEAAPAMVERLLSTWLTDQTVNNFTVAARPSMQDVVLSTFPRTADGQLDLGHAPFRLLAIANRIDLQDVAHGSAGEGRLAFGVLDAQGNPLQFTMIFEYNIPAQSADDVTGLANRWHALSSLPFPSEAYNAALQAITDGFTGRNAAPGRVNGSALGQFRSNDFFALGEWEFREFHLDAQGLLSPAPVALTPDRSLNNTQVLADYINANESSILLEKHTVPETFAGQPFLAGSMITNFFVWNAPGVNPEAREKFAINTCNGCHTSPLETNTFVFQLAPRSQGQESRLSPFLLGTRVFDFQAGVIRNINELGRRGRLLHDLVCPNDPLPPAPPATTPIGGGAGGRSGMGGRSGIGGRGGAPGAGGAGGTAGEGGQGGEGGAGQGGAGGQGGLAPAPGDGMGSGARPGVLPIP